MALDRITDRLPLLGGARLSGELERLQRQLDQIETEPTDEDIWRSVELARHPDRPYTLDYVHRLLDDWDNNVDHGEKWPLKIVTTKYNVVEGAKDVVDRAMTISGGAGMFKRNELERLYRDVRAGGFHPANSLLAHEIVGKIALGIDLGEQPRWG